MDIVYDVYDTERRPFCATGELIVLNS